MKTANEIINSIDYSYRRSKDIKVYREGARAYYDAVETLRSMGALRMLEAHELKLNTSTANWNKVNKLHKS